MSQASLKVHTVIDELTALQRLALQSIHEDRPLPDRQLFERALALTLTKPSISQVARAFQYVVHFGSHGQSDMQIGRSLNSFSVIPIGELQKALTAKELTGLAKQKYNGFARLWWDTVLGERLKFRWAIETFISTPTSARKELSSSMIEPYVDSIAAIPRLSWDGRRLHTDIHYQTKSIDGAIAYALMLMLDTDRGIGDALRLCKYKHCDQIFLSRPPAGGGPRPKYCKPEHKIAEDRLTGAERTARSRANPNPKRRSRK